MILDAYSLVFKMQFFYEAMKLLLLLIVLVHYCIVILTCVLIESSAVLANCLGYSRRSGFVAVDGCATLTMT